MADQHDVLDDSAVVLPFPAQTPTAPYYAVIFASTRTDGDNGYGAMADRMVELARSMPGSSASSPYVMSWPAIRGGRASRCRIGRR